MQAIEEIILGNSLVIKEMKKLIEMVSTANTTVLIQGETGTGKELVAEALHIASGRKGNNISVNCADYGQTVLEKNGWTDELSIDLASKEFKKFMQYEAYK